MTPKPGVGPSDGIPTAVRFGIAGASGISAWMFVHPMDVLKVRMQLGAGAGHPMAAAKLVYGESGLRGMYAGLSAAVTRQAVYTTLRVGLYDWIRDHVVHKFVKQEDINVLHRAAVGLTAGGIASFMCCPIEVCMVRMQSDARLPLADRLGYKHIGDALFRIAKEEGLRTYWRGATPTAVSRAMVVSMTQLGTYDQAKTALLPILGDNKGLHLASALTAAVVYSYASLPLDSAKTRMQSQAASTDGKPLKYTSTLQTLSHVAKSEGFFSLWKGFTPYFLRSGTHTVLMFMFKEEYTRLVGAYYGTS
ncbi:unnamed protein product [Ectocarpus sp. 13 AM-2016]